MRIRNTIVVKGPLIFISALVLFLSTAEKLYGQLNTQRARIFKYASEKGLSSSSQNCVIQDDEGFIWIGTADGLNRFDGKAFKIYRKISGDTTSLQSNIINCLSTDSKGTLWVGTARGGLSRYNKDKDNFVHYSYASGLSNLTITDIVEDHSGQLWVATFDGLNLFDAKTNRFKVFKSDPEKPNRSGVIASHQVRALALDGDVLWIGYTSGVISALNVTTKTFIHYKLFDPVCPQVKEIMVSSISVEQDKLWISTWGNGIWTFDKKTLVAAAFKKVTAAFINHLYISDDQLFIATESDGLLVYNKNRDLISGFKIDPCDPNSLSNNCISHIFQDRQNNLWLSSKKGYLHYLITDNPFRGFNKSASALAGLSDNNITSVLEADDRLWLGYNHGGIDVVDLKHTDKNFFYEIGRHGLGESTIVTLFKSRLGTVWVGTYQDGLKQFDPGTNRFLSYQHDPNNANTIACNSIRDITEDHSGNLWIATHGGGLDKLDLKTNTFTHHKVDYRDQANTISNDWLLSVLCDRHNNIWVGTGAGITVLTSEGKVIRHFKNIPAHPHSLSSDVVNVLFEDAQGAIWAGTHEGLNKLNSAGDSFAVFTTEDGLPNNIINGILEDNNGHLWISTTKGLSKFSIKENSFKNYFVEDGLETDEFTVASCFKNPKGEMYFGGLKGLNLFHPNDLRNSDFVPPVYIKDFKLFNQSVAIGYAGDKSVFTLDNQIAYTKEIVLNYDENFIGFEFVALDYVNSGKNRYSYMMEGLDRDWIKPENKNEATYTNLSPGTYTFKVQASNSDGIWSDKIASVHIVIQPPFWKTYWAMLLYVLLGFGVLYSVWSFGSRHTQVVRKLEMEEVEIEKLHEMDVQKTQFFTNVSHEFRTPLTLIVGPLDTLMSQTKDKKLRMQLELIQRNAHRLLRLISQLMDIRKLEVATLQLHATPQDLSGFLQSVIHSFLLDSRERKIEFTLIKNIEHLVMWFDRDKLEKILYNLVGNAFKFTPDGGKITVEVQAEHQRNTDYVNIKIRVTDSGIGIPKEAFSKIFDGFYQVKASLNVHGTGIGLPLAKELVQLHGGTITVESEMGLGSTFTVVIPMKVETRPGDLPVAGQAVYDITEHELSTDHVMEMHADGEDPKPLMLIVEDNVDMRFFIKSKFNNDYRILEASDGAKGLAIALEYIPDIIISDIMMPNTDGLTFCRKIKEHIYTSHIPVVLLTARSSEEHILEGLHMRADEYITKPFNQRHLEVRVNNLITSRKLLHDRFMNESKASSVHSISGSKTDDKFLSRAVEIVESNLSNADLDANDFAREIGMSRAQLYRKINALTGQSVKEFIRIIRLKKAGEMLITSDLNISHVAYEVGFNSVAYFTRSFSEYYGVTPSKFIALHKVK